MRVLSEKGLIKMGTIISNWRQCRRSIMLLLLMLISFSVLSGCSNEPKIPKEIQIVQQSKTSYGTVYDLLVEFNAQSTINKMPSYGEAIERYLNDVKWASGKDESGNGIVQVSGYMSYLGNYSEFIIEWIVKGDVEGNNAQVYYSGMAINGVNPGKGVFDTISVLMLYELGVINEEEVAYLGLFISLNNVLF